MLAVEASTATIWVAAIAAVASIVAGFFAMAGAVLTNRAKRTGTLEHGQVTVALDGLRDEVHDVARQLGSLRDQFIDHLQVHDREEP